MTGVIRNFQKPCASLLSLGCRKKQIKFHPLSSHILPQLHQKFHLPLSTNVKEMLIYMLAAEFACTHIKNNFFFFLRKKKKKKAEPSGTNNLKHDKIKI